MLCVFLQTRVMHRGRTSTKQCTPGSNYNNPPLHGIVDGERLRVLYETQVSWFRAWHKERLGIPVTGGFGCHPLFPEEDPLSLKGTDFSQSQTTTIYIKEPRVKPFFMSLDFEFFFCGDLWDSSRTTQRLGQAHPSRRDKIKRVGVPAINVTVE